MNTYIIAHSTNSWTKGFYDKTIAPNYTALHHVINYTVRLHMQVLIFTIADDMELTVHLSMQ